MFSQIVNPKTNRKVNINSKKGKEILTSYIGIQSGGKVEWDNYYQRFIATGGRATTERSLAEIRFLELLGVKYNGPDGVVENYARFWIKPNVRYHQFGYRNNHGRFIPMSLNDFLETLYINDYNHYNDILDSFIEIIRLRFEDSRQQARNRESDTLHEHHGIIRGMIEAYWNYAVNDRTRLNQLDEGFISRRLASLNWNEAVAGLNSSLLNFQIPRAYEREAQDRWELLQAGLNPGRGRGRGRGHGRGRGRGRSRGRGRGRRGRR